MSLANTLKQLLQEQDKRKAELVPVSHETQHLPDKGDTPRNRALSLILAGKSIIISGEAGTGKSTLIVDAVEMLLKTRKYSIHLYKVRGQGHYPEPGLACIAFTNTAKNILRDKLHQSEYIKGKLDAAITTINMLLEYIPDGQGYRPEKDSEHPLECDTIIIDEGSLVGDYLETALFDAMKQGTQLIIVGDLCQIPPVFGQSMIHRLLSRLPVIHLTEVYRQGEHNPLLDEARNVLKGIPPKQNLNVDDPSKPLGLYIPDTFKRIKDEEIALERYTSWIKNAYDKGVYNPMSDIIICPFRTPKRYISCHRINAYLADYINKESPVYEIIFNRDRFYFAVGDIVFVYKEQAVIVNIEENNFYVGEVPHEPSNRLNHLGQFDGLDREEEFKFSAGGELDEWEENEKDISYQSLSHIITVQFKSGETVKLNKFQDIHQGEIVLGYSTTGHKSQGGQWKRSIIVLHECHNILMNREWLYTSMTRSEELTTILIDKPKRLEQWVKITEIPGFTFEDKVRSLRKRYAREEIDLTKLGDTI